MIRKQAAVKNNINFTTMKLDDKTKELIAVGASVSANCQPCLDYHYNKALEYGADESEITEANNTGVLVRRGAAAKMDKFALSLNKETHSKKIDPDCGCNN
ncbi:MAG: carboxymuconolactone decarboxylase family protein [Ignavibacteria bacterium]|nr:carboxymuconolactone decarboxylase family protein [Ignavibacteria bacterium]